MPTSDRIHWKQRERSVQGRTQAADKTATSRRERSAHGERRRVSHKDRWTVEGVKGATVLMSPKNHTIFSQGEAADAVFYIQAGTVKLTVVSPQGQEAVVAMLERGACLGESCLAGQPVRTATAVDDSILVRLGQDAMIRALHEEPVFAERFLSYLLAHTMRMREDVVDQLFHSSEKRLARVLLLLAHFENDGQTEAVIPKMSQDVLAAMIGTTRSRVSCFLNRFRKRGFVHYNDRLYVHRSLRTVVLDDCRPSYG